ncbi:MAG: dihydrofolate reductase family protein [Chloroflexia bacterium]
MRKIVTSTFVTLDGIMQAPGGPGEDDSGGFKWGGWSVNYWDDMMAQVMGETLGRQPELLLGRKTYEIFAGYWPNAKDEPGADNLNNANKYVVSRTLDKVDWQNSTLIKGDVVKEITRLKELDGPELQVHGSSNLIQTLLKHNLIDEMQLLIYPVVIGTGKRLFGEGTNPSSFKLVDSKTSSSGVIIAKYAQSGELKTGSFALANTD